MRGILCLLCQQPAAIMACVLALWDMTTSYACTAQDPCEGCVVIAVLSHSSIHSLQRHTWSAQM